MPTLMVGNAHPTFLCKAPPKGLNSKAQGCVFATLGEVANNSMNPDVPPVFYNFNSIQAIPFDRNYLVAVGGREITWPHS